MATQLLLFSQKFQKHAPVILTSACALKGQNFSDGRVTCFIISNPRNPLTSWLQSHTQRPAKWYTTFKKMKSFLLKMWDNNLPVEGATKLCLCYGDSVVMVRWENPAGPVSLFSDPTEGLGLTVWDTQKGSTFSGAGSGPWFLSPIEDIYKGVSRDSPSWPTSGNPLIQTSSRARALLLYSSL